MIIFHSYVNLPEGIPKTTTAWWFGTMEFYDFPYIGNFISPTDELTPSFFRGVGPNHQPDRDIIKYIGNYRDISGYN